MTERTARVAQRLLALLGLLFGIVTIVAATRVLLGADPGYTVFRPLLIFNAAMGAVYVVAGAVAWRDVRRGKSLSAAICALNVVALAVVSYLHFDGGAVATESVKAMTLRTVVWLVLFVALASLGRRGAGGDRPTATAA